MNISTLIEASYGAVPDPQYIKNLTLHDNQIRFTYLGTRFAVRYMSETRVMVEEVGEGVLISSVCAAFLEQLINNRLEQ